MAGFIPAGTIKKSKLDIFYTKEAGSGVHMNILNPFTSQLIRNVEIIRCISNLGLIKLNIYMYHMIKFFQQNATWSSSSPFRIFEYNIYENRQQVGGNFIPFNALDLHKYWTILKNGKAKLATQVTVRENDVADGSWLDHFIKTYTGVQYISNSPWTKVSSIIFYKI